MTTVDAPEVPAEPSAATRAVEDLHRRWQGAIGHVRFLGAMALFLFKAIVSIPKAVSVHSQEVLKHIGELTLGKGLLFTFTGTLLVIFVESLFVGVNIGIEGFEALDMLGIGSLVGFISAYANTREIAPLIAAVAVASQIGCKFTAQLGAQRISEEIDAVETMAIPPIRFLVSTRMVAAALVVVPLYLVGLFGSFTATRLSVAILHHQSLGTYDHYFNLLLEPRDIYLSVAKVVVFTVLIVTIHTFYGFYATGGPQGVGLASARAIRASIVSIAAVDILMTMWFWGLSTIQLSGG